MFFVPFLGKLLSSIGYFGGDELCGLLNDGSGPSSSSSSLVHLFLLLDESKQKINQKDLFFLFSQNVNSTKHRKKKQKHTKKESFSLFLLGS